MPEVAGLTAQRTGWNTYRLTWTPTDSTGDVVYYIWQDGELLSSTVDTSADINVDTDSYHVLYVYDTSSDEPPPVYSGRVDITWSGDARTEKYRVERYIDGEWREMQTITATGSLFHRFTTPYLEDETTHLFRVIPIAGNGEEGPAQEYPIIMCRYPDIPSFDVVQGYDSTGTPDGWRVTLT